MSTTDEPQLLPDRRETERYFMNLLERGYIHRASREKGKFRAFLLADVKLILSTRVMCLSDAGGQ